MPGKYILACDDHGNNNWSSRSRTFTIGGFAVASTDRNNMVSAWDGIKTSLCGNSSVELKWSHFFPGPHQINIQNPLLEKDDTKWSTLALWALEELFNNTSAFPICTVVQKDKVSQSDLSETTRKGKTILSLKQIFPVLLGQFALYLEENAALSGEIWFDQLGSPPEHTSLQATLTNLLGSADPRYRSVLARISPTIQFFDSQQEPLIQLADFVSGVISAAAEGDEQFLRSLVDSYAPGAKRTYGILLL